MDLICQDIHFGLGEKKILKGVSLKVEGHQFHTILGPNGSGKPAYLNSSIVRKGRQRLDKPRWKATGALVTKRNSQANGGRHPI